MWICMCANHVQDEVRVCPLCDRPAPERPAGAAPVDWSALDDLFPPRPAPEPDLMQQLTDRLERNWERPAKRFGFQATFFVTALLVFVGFLSQARAGWEFLAYGLVGLLAAPVAGVLLGLLVTVYLVWPGAVLLQAFTGLFRWEGRRLAALARLPGADEEPPSRADLPRDHERAIRLRDPATATNPTDRITDSIDRITRAE